MANMKQDLKLEAVSLRQLLHSAAMSTLHSQSRKVHPISRVVLVARLQRVPLGTLHRSFTRILPQQAESSFDARG